MRKLALLLCLAASGCSSSDRPPDEASRAVVDVQFHDPVDSPTVLVLVVDDAPGDDAVLFRTRVGHALRSTLRSWAIANAGCDPAAWYPGSFRIFVVHPSATVETRIVGPSDNPSLSLDTPVLMTLDADALADAAIGELASFVANPAVPYRPIEAASDAAALLLGRRAPNDAHELALYNWAGNAFAIEIQVLSTRDDASPLATDSYPRDLSARVGTVLPLTPGSFCTGVPAAPRLAAWGSQPFDAPGWPCDDETMTARGLGRIYEPPSCLPNEPTLFCPAHPVRTLDDGTSACTLFATVPLEEDCAAQGRGWLDPRDPDGVRRPQTETTAPPPLRRCEVSQLTGDAGKACRETLACDGCGSGFCLTTVRPLAGDCARHEGVPMNPRFVGGAVHGSRARFDLVCDLTPN